MQKVLILGGGGMIGRKLAGELDQKGLNGARDLDVTLHDMAFPSGEITTSVLRR